MTKAKEAQIPVIIATAFDSQATAVTWARHVSRCSGHRTRVLLVKGQWRAFRVPEGRYMVQGRPEVFGEPVPEPALAEAGCAS